MNGGLKLSFVVLVACVVLMAAYSNHFRNSFHFDDSHTIETNLNIRDVENIPSFFADGSKFSSLPANQAYRPLLTTLNAIEYHMGNGDVFYFHLSSFFFYVVLCVAYYFLLLALFNTTLPSDWNRFIAILSVAVYSVHTVNAETINYISARSDSLSTLMVVASLVFYIYWPGHRRRLLYLIPLILGFLTKPTIAVFPLLLFFYLLMFEEGLSLGDSMKRKQLPIVGKCLLKTIPSWLTSIGMLVLSSKMTPETFTPSNITPLDYALTQPQAVLHYFISFFIPSGLSADIEYQAMSGIFDERVIVGCIFIVIMLTVMVRTSRMPTQRPVSYGLLWFFIASIPTSCGLVPLSESMNDHRMFFPFIGLMVSASWTVRLCWHTAAQRVGREKILKGAVALFLMLAFVGHAYGTHTRNQVWKDEESLWLDVTVKRPQNGRGLMNYGVVKMAKGEFKTALGCFERALIYSPSYAILHINLGIVKDAMGDSPGAEEYFQKAMALNDSHPGSYFYYARYMNRRDRHEQAIPLLQTCLRLSPGYTDARYLLMDIYARTARMKDLKELAAETLRLAPGDLKARGYAS